VTFGVFPSIQCLPSPAKDLLNAVFEVVLKRELCTSKALRMLSLGEYAI
jgi:hypothetical protein